MSQLSIVIVFIFFQLDGIERKIVYFISEGSVQFRFHFWCALIRDWRYNKMVLKSGLHAGTIKQGKSIEKSCSYKLHFQIKSWYKTNVILDSSRINIWTYVWYQINEKWMQFKISVDNPYSKFSFLISMSDLTHLYLLDLASK